MASCEVAMTAENMRNLLKRCFLKVSAYGAIDMEKRLILAIVLLSLALYILVPSLDEVLIHPIFGLYLSQILEIPITHGVVLSVMIYRSVGVICLSAALLIGGAPILQKLKARFGRRLHES